MLRKIEEDYGIKGEYPFRDDNESCVVRHEKNKKWFAIFMRVKGKHLGLKEEEKYDVVNVKCSPEEVPFLQNAEGILPAYHMNKTHWLTVLLNGDIPLEMAYDLIEKSYALIAKK